jgi:sensor histidine kinase YesM
LKHQLNILILLLFSFSLTVEAQQPSFQNFRSTSNPYLQFNDVIEFKDKIYLTTNEGVYQFKDKKLILVEKKQNLGRFIKTKRNLFVWSIYGEIFEIKKKKLIPFPFGALLTKKLNNKIINDVIYTDSTFWISTIVGGNLYQIDLRKEQINRKVHQPDYPFYIVQYNQQLISGCNTNPIHDKLIISLGKKPLLVSLAENKVFSKTTILKLQDGTFLFTKQHEAVRFNSSKTLNRIFSEKNIEAVIQDSHGRIWFALNNGGVISYADGKLLSTNAIRYLGNTTVMSIIEDGKGNLWFGTSGNGLYLLEKPLEIEYKSPQIFSSTNQNNEEQTAFIIKNRPVVNDSSSTVLRTDIKRADTIPPTVFVNNIKINGTDTTTLNYYELPYSQNNIEINISGVENNNAALQYKYILQGKEDQWNYSVKTNIYYASLLPGNYTFIVYAMNDNGIWSKTPAVITFHITAPVWTSFWFIVTVVLLGIALILLFAFFIHRKAQRRDQLLKEEKQKALVSELQALRAQMNPHFIFNTLSSIQSFITQNNTNDAVGYLSKFAKLMRSTLENTKKKKVSLKDEITALELYLQLEQLRLDNKFNYQIKVDENIDTQFEQIPSMLIQPYVENAIWHGISHKETNGEISISFSLVNENVIKCIIEDDGIGRKKAMEIAAKNRKNNSLGMSITKERLAIINSLGNNKLSLEIKDLEKNQRATGTRITLFIPLD